MTAVRRAAWVLSAVLVAAPGPGRAAPGGSPPQNLREQRPVFRSGTDLVRVDVSVRDRTKAVTGLTAADFVVLDNGVRQTILDVSYGKLPIDVTVALDASYSVTGDKLDRLRRAVRQLMSDLGTDDRLKLMTFNQHVSRTVDFTSDAPAVERAMAAVTAGGATSIFDALSVALVSASDPDRRQLVVVFTDGQDSLSVTEPTALLDVARHAVAAVTAVVPFQTTSVSRPVGSFLTIRQTGQPETPLARAQATTLAELAAETGGRVIPVGPAVSLADVFRRALDLFRSSYVLHFSPRGVTPGGFHTLTVTVPRDSKFTVQARRGYFGG
jgi:VWFA-related protein